LAPDGEVDPWSYFVNAYVVDRQGRRIDRRNAEDIFIALYDHQIPPGAAAVVHYRLQVPPDLTESLTVDVKLLYRKFDTTYVRAFQADDFSGNTLPIMTLAEDRVTFSIDGAKDEPTNADTAVPEWQRWNDYGIGLLRAGNAGSNQGELRQAEVAFARVEALQRPDGPLNRARVYLKEGRLAEAVEALTRAAEFKPPAPAWSIAWFTGLVNKQNGHIDEAIQNFRAAVEMDTDETRRRGFDFSLDYRLLNELGQALFERSKQERGVERTAQRNAYLSEAVTWFERSLNIDPENTAAHYNLSLLHSQLGNAERAGRHRALHTKYKVDDNARDHAIAAARLASPAANHAAEAVVIYDLQRAGAYELAKTERTLGIE
jgi:tetratricopeptide (TPR) repeat protein